MKQFDRALNVFDVASKTARSSVLAYPAEPVSASRARHFVRDCLTDAGTPLLVVDRVELAVSELVTNSILHATTCATVRLHTDEQRVRLEVHDASITVPVVTHYGENAATGRGLAVVSSAATRWGVDASQYGKSVWAEFDLREDDDPSDETAPIRHTEIIVEAELDENTTTLSYRGVPVALFLQLEQCNDAMLREFELLSIQVEDGAPTEGIGPQLSPEVVQATHYFNKNKHRLRNAVARAHARGQEYVDLNQTVDASAVEYVQEIGGLLAEADALSESGILLTAPTPEPLRRLRHWFCDEMYNQFYNRRPPSPYAH